MDLSRSRAGDFEQVTRSRFLSTSRVCFFGSSRVALFRMSLLSKSPGVAFNLRAGYALHSSVPLSLPALFEQVTRSHLSMSRVRDFERVLP